MDRNVRQSEELTFEEFISIAEKGARWDRFVASAAGFMTPLSLVPLVRRRLVELRCRKEAALKARDEMRSILAAMTPDERKNPDLIDHARRAAIAQVAGCDPFSFSRLRQSFNAARKAYARFSMKLGM
jgi:signal recognition particle GTPase